MMLPPLPIPKSYQQLSIVSTLKDGVCSCLSGDLYQSLSPHRLTGSCPSRDMKVAKGIDFISLNIVVKSLGVAVQVRLTYIHTVPN